ncbi:mitogen-activated protein kinase 5 [Pelomyxa schiedti]|nr:mitogen-activated protein kinase 5 [Pelomyxa schiedti]
MVDEPVPPEVLDKYNLVQRMRNSYIVTWQGTEKATSRRCFIKRVIDIFQDKNTTMEYCRELHVLLHLGKHENIVDLIDFLFAKNSGHLFVIYEFIEYDLYQVIRAGILEPVHKQYIVYQILKALSWIHSAGLIHCQIKPSNVLIIEDCSIKLCGFDRAEGIGIQQPPGLTDICCTRWYTAPEVFLGCSRVTPSYDLWSVGCILAEMVTQKPIFPGNSTLNTLERIISFTGPPSPEDQDAMQSPFAGHVLESLARRKNDWADLIKSCTPDAMDLLRWLLVLNPFKRPSANEALSHPFLSQFHDSDVDVPIYNFQTFHQYPSTTPTNPQEFLRALSPPNTHNATMNASSSYQQHSF